MFDDERYPALRIFIMFAADSGSDPDVLRHVCTLSGGIEQFQNKPTASLVIAALVALGPLTIGLLLFASSEVLRLLIDIEENTRKASEELDLLPLTLRKTERE